MSKIFVEQTQYGIKIFSGDNSIEFEDFTDIHNLVNDLQEKYDEQKLKYLDNFLLFIESEIDNLDTIIFSSIEEIDENKKTVLNLQEQLDIFVIPDKRKYKIRKKVLYDTLEELLEYYDEEKSKLIREKS